MCEDKGKYTTKRLAMNVARKARRRTREPIYAYHCVRHDCWHIGHNFDGDFLTRMGVELDMPAAKRRKTKRTTMKNKADRLFSIRIRERDRVCVSCGTTQNLQCAHIFSRRYHNVRWDDRNAIALCAGCHKRYTHDPIAWENFIVERMGTVAYSQLRSDAQRTDLKVDYEQLLDDLANTVAVPAFDNPFDGVADGAVMAAPSGAD